MEARISRALLERLLAEAAASPSREVCGLLFSTQPSNTTVRAERSRSAGSRRIAGGMSLDFARDERTWDVGGAASAANVSPNPFDSFEIDPAAVFAALRTERAGGPRMIGHYHSHPRGPARPSPRDAAAAEPGRLWLILGEGRATAWRALAGGAIAGAFEPIMLEITGEAGCAP